MTHSPNWQKLPTPQLLEEAGNLALDFLMCAEIESL